MLDQRAVHLQLVVDHEPAVAPRPPWLGIGLIVLGVGIAVTSVLGPLLLGVIDYHVADAVEDQVTGGDIAALFLTAPIAIYSGVLAMRRRPEAPVLALAPSLFATYMYIQLGSGGDPALHSGNSEMFFGLHLGLIVLSASIAIASWRAIDAATLPVVSRRAFRFFGWVSIGVAAFLALGLHLPHLIDVWSGEPSLPTYFDDPQVFWLVKLMDLGIVVPALVVVGVGAVRQLQWAHMATYATVGALALLASSVAAMAIAMQIGDDPEAAMSNTMAFTAFASAFLAMAAWLYAPLLRRGAIDHRAHPSTGRR